MTSSGDFPKYENPPVREVVMSIQFDPLTRLTPVHLGRWWDDRRREQYPLTEERPPLQSTKEEFTPSVPPNFNFKISGAPMTPAVWFLTPNRSELLQIQRDRFSRNWTGSEAGTYPSFEQLRPAFADDFGEFRRFLIGEGIGDPLITQCEITYVNPIEAGDGWQRLGELGKVFAPWSGSYAEGFLPEPEDVQLATRFVIPGASGEPIGRLYVTLQPGFDPATLAPRMLLTLSARGRPLSPGYPGAEAFLEVGHEWIVKGFSTLTTEEMQKRWGRK